MEPPDIRWDDAKNDRLKRERGVSFDEIIAQKLLAVKRHPGRGHQRLMLFEHKDYVWVVPYVAHGGEIFLKTIFPSRKYTKLWREGKLR
ncbi:MAG TPA: toxin [Elusimicrobiota bacterium]|nr:toxin [Elusimicrobiota bacterium]